MSSIPALISFFLILLLLFSSPIPSSSTPCHPHDEKALAAIDAHFRHPPLFSTWRNPSVSCCDRNNITCDVDTGRIRELVLTGGNLSGTLPPAIGDLPELEILFVTNSPNLVGPIPSTIIKLKKVIFIDFSRNSLSGPIPDFLWKLTSLSILSLQYNKFSGSIPPSLAKLQNLNELQLDHNQLTGSIPESFGTFPKMGGPSISLSHNKLSGPIPASLGEPGFSIIDLSSNRLTGDASFLFGSNKSANEILLAGNQFSFDLTHLTFPLFSTVLDLRHNLIYGSIPAQINEVTILGLRTFNVSYNQLCGKIPRGVVTAKFNKYAYSNNKCLCGAPLSPCKY